MDPERAPFKEGPAAQLWGVGSRCRAISPSCSLSRREWPCEVTALPGVWAKWRVKTQTLPVSGGGTTRPRAGLTLQPPLPIQQVLVPKAHRAPERSLASQDPTWRTHLAAQHVFI